MSATGAARSDLTRWAVCALVVVGLHGAGGGALLGWHDPIGWGGGSSAIEIDLAPYVAPSDSPDDLAPGPLQQQAALPAPQQTIERKVEREPEEKVEVPPAPVPPVAAVPPPPDVVEPPPPPVTPPEPEAQPVPPSETPPAPVTTAPPRQRVASAAETDKWHQGIVDQIELHKDYPAAARARGQVGVVQLVFSIDRQGRVISSRVAHASGYAALDRAAMATLQQAQPFPPPPNGLAGEEFSFRVPVRFSFRLR